MSNDPSSSSNLGAFQTQSDALDVNTTADDPVGSDQLSLRDAVNLANVLGSAPGVDQTITFDSSLTSGTINLTGGPIEIDDTFGTLTIDGAGSTTPITVNPASGESAFANDSGSTAEIDGLTIGGAVTTAGTLTLNGDINPTANNFSVEVLDGGTLNLPTSIELASLTIDAGGLAKQTSTDTTFGSEILTVGSLTINDPSGSTNGGVLDLGDGDLIAKDTDASGIYTLLAAGYDGGFWDGQAASGTNPASILSSAAANDPYAIESLGFAQIGTATDEGELNLTTFDGQTVNSGDTVVALTYYGDANLDRQVNSTDYGMIGAQYPYTGVDIGGWTGGDFNYDGTVDETDANLFEYATNVLAMLAATTQGSGATVASSDSNSTTDGNKITLKPQSGQTYVTANVQIQLSGNNNANVTVTVKRVDSKTTGNGSVAPGVNLDNGGTTDAGGGVVLQVNSKDDTAWGTFVYEIDNSDGQKIGQFSVVVPQP